MGRLFWIHWGSEYREIYVSTICDDTQQLVGLTHWVRVTHICVGELTIIVSDNSLSPERRQAIIWTSAWILLIGPYGTNFSEISIEILIFSFTQMSLKVSPAKWRPFCPGLNELNIYSLLNRCPNTEKPGAATMPVSLPVVAPEVVVMSNTVWPMTTEPAPALIERLECKTMISWIHFTKVTYGIQYGSGFYKLASYNIYTENIIS